MSRERESRPTGNQAASNISGGDNPSLADPAGNPAFDAQLIASNPQARAVDWAAYRRGYLDGHADAQLSQEQAADLAARKFYAMEAFEVENRRRTQLDREWFDVARARAEGRAA